MTKLDRFVPRIDFSRHNSLHADLWVYTHHDDVGKIKMVTPHFKENWWFPYEDWYPLSNTCTYGNLTSLPCPGNTNGVLTSLYDDTWRVPKKKFKVRTVCVLCVLL